MEKLYLSDSELKILNDIFHKRAKDVDADERNQAVRDLNMHLNNVKTLDGYSEIEEQLLTLLLERMVDVSADVSTITVSSLSQLLPKLKPSSIGTILSSLTRLLVSEDAARPHTDVVIINADGSQNRPVYDSYVQALRQTIIHSPPQLLASQAPTLLSCLQQCLSIPYRSSKTEDIETRDNICIGIAAVIDTLLPAVSSSVWVTLHGCIDRTLAAMSSKLESSREPLRVHSALALGHLVNVASNEAVGKTISQICEDYQRSYQKLVLDPHCASYPESYVKCLTSVAQHASSRLSVHSIKIIESLLSTLPVATVSIHSSEMRLTFKDEATASLQTLWGDAAVCIAEVVKPCHPTTVMNAKLLETISEAAYSLAQYDPYSESSSIDYKEQLGAERAASQNAQWDRLELGSVEESDWIAASTQSEVAAWEVLDDEWGSIPTEQVIEESCEDRMGTSDSRCQAGMGVNLTAPNDCSRLVRLRAVELLNTIVTYIPSFTTLCFSKILNQSLHLLKEHEATVLSSTLKLVQNLVKHSVTEVSLKSIVFPPSFSAQLHLWLSGSCSQATQHKSGQDDVLVGQIEDAQKGFRIDANDILVPEIPNIVTEMSNLAGTASSRTKVELSIGTLDLFVEVIRATCSSGSYSPYTSLGDYSAEFINLCLKMIRSTLIPEACRCLSVLLSYFPFGALANQTTSLIDAFLSLLSNPRCSEAAVGSFSKIVIVIRTAITQGTLSNHEASLLVSKVLSRVHSIYCNKSLPISHRINAITECALGLVTCDLNLSLDEHGIASEIVGLEKAFSDHVQNEAVRSGGLKNEAINAVKSMFLLMDSFNATEEALTVKELVDLLEALALIGIGASATLLVQSLPSDHTTRIMSLLDQLCSKPSLPIATSSLKLLICIANCSPSLFTQTKHLENACDTGTGCINYACEIFRKVWGVWTHGRKINNPDNARSSIAPLCLALSLIAIVLRDIQVRLTRHDVINIEDVITNAIVFQFNAYTLSNGTQITENNNLQFSDFKGCTSLRSKSLMSQYQVPFSVNSGQSILSELLPTLFWIHCRASSCQGESEEPISHVLSANLFRVFEKYSINDSSSDERFAKCSLDSISSSVGVCLGGIVYGLTADAAYKVLEASSILWKASCLSQVSNIARVKNHDLAEKKSEEDVGVLYETLRQLPHDKEHISNACKWMAFESILKPGSTMSTFPNLMSLCTSQMLFHAGSDYLKETFASSLFQSLLNDCSALILSSAGKPQGSLAAYVRILGVLLQNSPTLILDAMLMLETQLSNILHIQCEDNWESDNAGTYQGDFCKHFLLLTGLAECLSLSGQLAPYLPSFSARQNGTLRISKVMDREILVKCVPKLFEIAAAHCAASSKLLKEAAVSLIGALFLVAPLSLRISLETEIHNVGLDETTSEFPQGNLQSGAFEVKIDSKTREEARTDAVLLQLENKICKIDPDVRNRIAFCGSAAIRAALTEAPIVEDRVTTQGGGLKSRLCLESLSRSEFYEEVSRLVGLIPIVLTMDNVNDSEQLVSSMGHVISMPKSSTAQAIIRSTSWPVIVGAILKKCHVRPELIQKHTAGPATHYTDAGLDLRLGVCLFADKLLSLACPSQTKTQRMVLTKIIPSPIQFCKTLLILLKDFAPDHSMDVIKRASALISQCCHTPALEKLTLEHIAPSFHEMSLDTIKHHYAIVRADVSRRENNYKQEMEEYGKGTRSAPSIEEPTPECNASMEVLRFVVEACAALHALPTASRIQSLSELWNNIILASQHTKQIVKELGERLVTS